MNISDIYYMSDLIIRHFSFTCSCFSIIQMLECCFFLLFICQTDYMHYCESMDKNT